MEKSIRKHMEQRVDSGVPLINVVFETGFKACLESVRVKGHEELAKQLELELSMFVGANTSKKEENG